jgi:hypothetical protein
VVAPVQVIHDGTRHPIGDVVDVPTTSGEAGYGKDGPSKRRQRHRAESQAKDLGAFRHQTAKRAFTPPEPRRPGRPQASRQATNSRALPRLRIRLRQWA